MKLASGVRMIGLLCGAASLTAPVSAQLYFKSPNFSGAPITGTDATVLIPLPDATPAEQNAEITWTLRAGLNFAALQCQFAPSLMTVSNYNAVITHHSKELNADYKILQDYFKRKATRGTTAAAVAASFDNFNTRTYSSFSSVFAQLGFCQTASHIGEAALMQSKGKLLVTAQGRLRELRNSLKPIGDSINERPNYAFNGSEVPGYAPECFDKKGQLKKRCL